MNATHILAVYALSSWTYVAVDMWRKRDEGRKFFDASLPEGFTPSPQLYWMAIGFVWITWPFVLPFVALGHFVNYVGKKESE